MLSISYSIRSFASGKGACKQYDFQGRLATRPVSLTLVNLQVDRAVELTVKHVETLREMSPLWEMVQEGIDIKSIQWSQH